MNATGAVQRSRNRGGRFTRHERSAVTHLMESVIIVKIIVFATLFVAVALYHYLYR